VLVIYIYLHFVFQTSFLIFFLSFFPPPPPPELQSESRDSSVRIALGYGLDDRGSRVRFPTGAGNFSLHHRVQNGSGAHPTSYPMGNECSFPGVKRPGRETNHSPPSSAVKECVELYLHSPIRIHGVVLSQAQNYSQSYFAADGQSVSQFILALSHSGTHDQILAIVAVLLVVGRLPSREDGSVL
jgi:hypothetical protein